MAKGVFNEGRDYLKGAYVGPYWFVRDDSETIRLIAHRCALAEAEEYGDYLTCPRPRPCTPKPLGGQWVGS